MQTLWRFRWLIAGLMLISVVAAGVVEWKESNSPSRRRQPIRYLKPGSANRAASHSVAAGETRSIGVTAQSPVPLPSVGKRLAPGELIEQILVDAEALDPMAPAMDRARLAAQLRQLRDAGPEGARAIRDFFRSKVDVLMGRGGFAMEQGRLTQFPTVRAALLEALYDMSDPVAIETSVEVLRTTSSGFEALLAVRNLEHGSPGAYRQDALKAVSEILSRVPKPADAEALPRNLWLDWQLLEVVAHYQSVEMVPKVEEVLRQQPQLTQSWLNALVQMPPQVQADCLQRLMHDDKTRPALLANTYYLGQVDFQSEANRQVVREVFSQELPAIQKEQLVREISLAGLPRVLPSFMAPAGRGNAPTIPASRPRAEGALKLLREIEPLMNTPSLRSIWNEAQRRVQSQLR